MSQLNKKETVFKTVSFIVIRFINQLIDSYFTLFNFMLKN